jgi:hypothetical protein
VLEVETPWWPADGTTGNTPAHPGNEHRKSTLGSATHPRRASQARRRYRSDDAGRQVRESVLAHPATHHQRPFAVDRIDGNIDPTIAGLLVRFVPVGMHSPGSDHAPDITGTDSFVAPTHWLRTALCLRHRSAKPQRPCLDQRHNKSECRMGCASANGSIPQGTNPRRVRCRRPHLGHCLKGLIDVD